MYKRQARDLSSFAPDDHVVRVTFNGSSTAKPLVASLAAEKGILVSVLSADTRDPVSYTHLITITGSTNLSENEIQRAMADAAAYEAEDSRRKER